jgi:anaerobic selenocysteine-containing dehydrogenase
MHVLVAEGLHDEAWLRANTVGCDDMRERIAHYPPARVAEMTGVPEATIVALARRYGTTKPAMIKFADGIQRHGNGGQTSRALTCLPALVGQYGVRGGGLFYSTSGYVAWNGEALAHINECPPTPRVINMNRLGVALTGEAHDPPVMSLYVFNANPVTSTPNAGEIVRGMQRDDLFTVVHELFMTDTAHYADIVLPATSQLEHADLHKAYGQLTLQYNAPAIAPLGECKSNWDVMRLLAAGMGYTDYWLQHDEDAVMQEVLDATRTRGRDFIRAALDGITLERLKREGSVSLSLPNDFVPFADLHFPTASGKVALRCDVLAGDGIDPLPEYVPPPEFAAAQQGKPDNTNGTDATSLVLLSGAPHHFVSSSLANLDSLRKKEGPPFIEINPADAAARGIAHGEEVIVENARGWCALQAVLTDDVPPGVAVAPKGHWAQFSPEWRNVNWTTSDSLADLGGQSTFHSNLVQVRSKQ